MFTKVAAAFALFAASAQLVSAAVPPACLLLALEGEKNPADLPTVCGEDYKKMTSSLSEGCNGDAFEGAMSAYNSVCKKTPKTSHSSSASKTSSGSHSSATGYGSHTPSAHMAVVTSVVYDKECDCSKTTEMTTKITAVPGSSTVRHVAPTGSALAPFPVNNGTMSASAAGPIGPGGAGGTGVVPVGSQPTATTASAPPDFSAAAIRTEMNLAGAAIAAGALAFLL